MLTLNISEGRGNFKTFNCTNKQAQAIAQLREAHKGFAAVKGYIPSTSWTVRPVQNIQMIIGFVTSRLYKRQVTAMRELTIDDLNTSKWIPSKGKNSCATAQEQFDFCIALAAEQKSKSLAGELENAHTTAHKRNYLTISNSIKVNFVTEKINGLQIPVLDANGIPTVDSILVPYLEIKTVTVEAGERKNVNSGSKVLMDQAINQALSKRLAFKQISLKDDNFDSLTVGRENISSEGLSGAVKIMESVS